MNKALKSLFLGMLIGIMAFGSFCFPGNWRVSANVYASGNNYTVTGTTNYLALRSFPGYDGGNEIGKLYNGETVQLIDYGNGSYWYVCSPKLGINGYVNKKYLTPAASSQTYTNSTSVASASGSDYRVSGVSNYLALRNAAVYDSRNEIGRLYNGDTVEVHSKSGTYWYVYSPKLGLSGYVNSSYLAPGGSPAPAPQPSYETYTVRTTENYLALRSSAAYNSSNEIGKLYNGDTVELKSEGGIYWYVYSPKLGKSGYVNSKYLYISRCLGD